MRDFFIDVMVWCKLDLEMLKMVESILLESLDFSLNKKMFKDVCVVLVGVFLIFLGIFLFKLKFGFFNKIFLIIFNICINIYFIGCY